MHSINWPDEYLPGTTDNFVSNEVIVKDLSAADVWPWLSFAEKWPSYYDNSADIAFHGGAGPELALGTRFSFRTFGFPIEAEVVECEPPEPGKPGRMAWHGWAEGDAETRLDVIHAWLIEDLPGGRVRILTQESQIGKPAQALAQSRPNTMLNGHQAWLDGLVDAARKARTTKG